MTVLDGLDRDEAEIFGFQLGGPANFAYSGGMRWTFVMRNIPGLLLVPFLLCACGTPEVLLPKSAAVPAGVDFSGKWQLRPESMRDQPRVNEAIDRTDGVDNKTIMREMINRQKNARYGSRGGGETKGGLVGVFLETGDSLKIDQTPDAIFISFDRAVVEEFRFGENRPISIGQADAFRVSGWEGDSYVIETLGEKGMKLTDRYSLADDKQSLIRQITLRSKELEEVTIVQKFDRQAD